MLDSFAKGNTLLLVSKIHKYGIPYIPVCDIQDKSAEILLKKNGVLNFLIRLSSTPKTKYSILLISKLFYGCFIPIIFIANRNFFDYF